MQVHLSKFMIARSDAIVDEWQLVAGPVRERTNAREFAELRQVLKDVVMSIAIATLQAGRQSSESGGQCAVEVIASRVAAARHGALRQGRGIGTAQLVNEFSALRVIVLRLWRCSESRFDAAVLLDQMLQFNQALDAALRESIDGFVAALTAARDAYLFTLGQDLRLPLESMHAANTVLGRPDFSTDTRRVASRRVHRALVRMDGLRSDLMEYTRNRGLTGIPVDRTLADVRALCEESIEIARTMHPGLGFEAGFSGDLVTSIDSPRLQQALSNLLHNAVVHGDGVTPVRLTALATRTRVTLDVWNAGPAIPAGAMRSIFEPRIRAPRSNPAAQQDSATSFGLGLFIVREIALGHGGEVAVVSTESGGTRFTIHLPRAIECGASVTPMRPMTAGLSDRVFGLAGQAQEPRPAAHDQ